MKSLAIIGSGISALGAAYYLRERFDITIFEKNDYVGGHTNTILVDEQGGPLPVDTGFIVFNHHTYPNLIRLFDRLGVQSQASNMSFAMYNIDSGLQFSGQSWNALFAQRRNVLRPAYWRLLLQANRFNSTAVADLEEGRAEMSMGEYLERNGYDAHFVENYILPMGSAVWSTPIDRMLEFPAGTMIRFFKNHGFLGMYTQLEWRTLVGGSHSYVKRILAALPRPPRLNAAVSAVRPDGDGVMVRSGAGEERFDRVLIAAHADEALAMLSEATPLQRELLSAFAYQKNTAILHTDEKAMPPSRRTWSAWNYKLESDRQGSARTATVYWMNRLQNLPTRQNYFVSINEFQELRPECVLRRIDYTHPLFDARAVEAQKRLQELNNGPIYFAGSYFRYGFHEDGLLASLLAAERILNGAESLVAV